MFVPFELEIAIAVAALASPIPFLLVVAAAVVQLVRGRRIGTGLATAAAFTGGLTAGTLILAAPNVLIALPVVGIPAWVAWTRWRAGDRRLAGWLLAGLALPWTALHVITLVALPDMEAAESGLVVPARLLAGAIALAIGLAAALRPNPPPPAPSMAAPAGQPGSRNIGAIAAAIRGPGMVGPFGLPEIAMLIAFVGTWMAVPFLVPREWPFPLHLAIPGVVAGVVATEAYIRAMPSRSRRAFEAFSWLGEWELARARRVTGGNVPTSELDAEHWLVQRPERLAPTLDEAFLRVEVLLLVARIDEARALLRRIDERAVTPFERFEVAALRDLVSWRSGEDGDLPGMDAAAAEVLPRDGEDRLRAEVMIAVAQVRRLMADGRAEPGDAGRPLLEVRDRLGSRADGQVGRALRRRLIPVLVVSGIVFGVVLQFTGAIAELELPF